jgi:nucleoid-associated protein YgaU
MTDPLQALIAAGAIPSTSFPTNSRYAATPILAYDPGDGTPPVAYLGRRLLPQPADLNSLGDHTVVAGDRLDNLAARYLGDPELWWRIADGTVAPHLDDLTETIGLRLRMTLSPGVPGVAGA